MRDKLQIPQNALIDKIKILNIKKPEASPRV